MEDQLFKNNEDDSQVQTVVIIPKGLKYVSYVLSLAGIILILLGFAYCFNKDIKNITKACSFWIIGCLCSIPGIYYTVKIIKAYMAKTNEEKL